MILIIVLSCWSGFNLSNLPLWILTKIANILTIASTVSVVMSVQIVFMISKIAVTVIFSIDHGRNYPSKLILQRRHTKNIFIFES
jgi:hypothetical protein